MESHRPPKEQDNAITFGCPLELYNKTIAEDTIYVKPRPWKIKLEPTLSLHPYWLAFTGLEGALHAPEKSNQQFYTSVNPESYNNN